MKFVSKIALGCAFVFATPLSFAGASERTPLRHGAPAEAHQQGNVKQGVSTRYGEIKLKNNQHIVMYLPTDVRSYQQLSYRCNDQGQPTDDVFGGCLVYVSQSTNSKWLVRFVQPASAGERIYKVTENGHMIPYVQFDAKDVSRVIYASAEASKYAQAHGAGGTQVAREGAPPTQAPAQQQAKVDCDPLGFLQRIACEAANNAGLGAAIGAGVRALGK